MSREARTIIALEAIAGTKLAEASDLAVSVRVLFGAGAGMGAGLFFAHWQGALGLFFPLWQQQHSRLDRDFPQQQQAVPFRQHAALPAGVAALAAPAQQSQPDIGRASAGISKAASHTRARTAIALRENI